MVDSLLAEWRRWPQWVLGQPSCQGSYSSGGRFRGVVAIWLGALTHGVSSLLAAAIAFAVDDGDDTIDGICNVLFWGETTIYLWVKD